MPDRSRILVVGALGFYGARVADALERRGHRVVRGARSVNEGDGWARVDLLDPATFAAFAGVDAVVNCTDSVNAPADAAASSVLREGGIWLEMGADAATVARLSALQVDAPRGAVVLGVGVFPGLSTLLAREVAERAPTCHSVELGIRFSPLSGAGRGNCALMAASLFVPATWFTDGNLQRARLAVGPSASLPYGDGGRAAFAVTLPDTALIHRATQAPTVIASMSLRPAWLRWNFLALAGAAWLLSPLRRPVTWMMTWQLAIVRAWLLRGRESTVELTVLVDRGRESERGGSLDFADGQAATAAGVVAVVEAIARSGGARPGVLGVAERWTLADVWPLR